MGTPAADVSTLVASLGIDDVTKTEAVVDALTKFATVSKAEKEVKRVETLVEVFPLLFGDDAVIEGKHEDYEKLREFPWSTKCYLQPKCFVVPRTPEDVATILRLCKFLNMQFSIRCNGYLCNAGFQSNNGGVVISLKNFNTISCNEDRSVARIGAGLSWIEVYRELEEKYDLAVPGARVPFVGVSGFLLGGGVSFHDSKNGISCMNVVNYQIVLADGRIVDANANENPDLFWGLKGGYSNFGVVTRFDMTTCSNMIWANVRLIAPSEHERLLEALIECHEACAKDPLASFILMFKSSASLLVLFYGAKVENLPVFNVLNDIPHSHLLPPAYRKITETVMAMGGFIGPPAAHEGRTISTLPDLEMYKVGEACRLRKVVELKDVPGINITWVIQPFTKSTVKMGEKKCGNALGIEAKDQQWFFVLMDWEKPEDDDRVIAAGREIEQTMEAVAKKNGTYLRFKYGNYSSSDQNTLVTYGEENLAKLKEIAAKYDPEAIFQKLQYGGWLVSKA